MFTQFKTVLARSSQVDLSRARYTIYVSWVLLPVIVVFPMMNTFSGTLANVVLGLIAVIVVENVLIYTTNWQPGQKILPFIGVTVAVCSTLYFLYLGYGDGAAAMWIFVVPVLSAFMLGVLWGGIAAAISVLGGTFIMLNSSDLGGHIYGNEFSLRFVFSFSLVTALTLGYEYWRVALEIEKEAIGNELTRTRDALAELSTVCSWCHSIKTKTDSWQSLENYVTSKEHKTISHSICPECSAKQLQT